jgi:hypothetical protein
MTDTLESTRMPSVLAYDDLRAVSPALEHYSKVLLLADYGSAPSFRRVTAASSPWPLLSRGSSQSRCPSTSRWHSTTA